VAEAAAVALAAAAPLEGAAVTETAAVVLAAVASAVGLFLLSPWLLLWLKQLK
jgi:hypothetical protein